MKKFYRDEEDELYYSEPEPTPMLQADEFGCGFCWDKKRNRDKELFFLDAANNMRVCTYCPSCGRKYEN